MNLHAISHTPYSQECYGIGENHVCLRVRAARGEAALAAVFYRDRFEFNGNRPIFSKSMELIASDALFDHFEAILENAPERLAYYFKIADKKGDSVYLSVAGIAKAPPGEEDFSDFFELHYNHRADIARCPRWLQEAAIYQIFPDSFSTGYRELNIKERGHKREDGGISHAERGGTLRGITQNLDYISDMGFKCLYLNPIFTANTPHRYDTADYMDIDPLLGTKADFRELVTKAHALGMRVILDGVFNHIGTFFFAFQDVIKNGAASPYIDWFYKIDGFPVDIGSHTRKPNYATFAYTGHMPKLNLANPEAARYFIDVILYWIKEFDIDGWRLDVADEVNAGFWRAARAEMLAAKPDAVFIGEIWGDARRWLQGDMFDSLMNYAVMYSCQRFILGETDAAQFADSIGAQLTRYKAPYQYAQMNLLDSHDTPRFLGKLGGNIEAYKLALTYQILHVGAPSVYYGDELGLSDTAQPLWRNSMPWEKCEDHPIARHIKELLKLREAHMDAMRGRFKTRFAVGRVYAFERIGEKSLLLVILNASEDPAQADIPGAGIIALKPWESRIDINRVG